MALRKDTLITTKETRYFPAGGLHQLVPYVNWKLGSPTITLDGDFTIAELQWLIDHMSSTQPVSNVHNYDTALPEAVVLELYVE